MPPFTFRGDWAPDVEYRCGDFYVPGTAGIRRSWTGRRLRPCWPTAEETVTWSGNVAVLHRADEDEEIRLEPDEAGRSHTHGLGWTFVSEPWLSYRSGRWQQLHDVGTDRREVLSHGALRRVETCSRNSASSGECTGRPVTW